MTSSFQITYFIPCKNPSKLGLAVEHLSTMTGLPEVREKNWRKAPNNMTIKQPSTRYEILVTSLEYNRITGSDTTTDEYPSYLPLQYDSDTPFIFTKSNS